MRLYEGTIAEFSYAVLHNRIADEIRQSFEKYYKKKVSGGEYRAWQSSLNFLHNAFECVGLKENRIVVEYELPYSTRRIDVLIFGTDHTHSDSIVLIELKQWSNENVQDSPSEGNIIVDFGRFTKEQAHPSLQVEGYHYDLRDFMTIFSEAPELKLNSCVYCHNYSHACPDGQTRTLTKKSASCSGVRLRR